MTRTSSSNAPKFRTLYPKVVFVYRFRSPFALFFEFLIDTVFGILRSVVLVFMSRSWRVFALVLQGFWEF